MYIYTNVDTLLNKRPELQALISVYHPHVIGITEVKPKNSRYDLSLAEIQLDGYEVFHNLKEDGRGVYLYISCSLRPEVFSGLSIHGYRDAVFAESNFQ